MNLLDRNESTRIYTVGCIVLFSMPLLLTSCIRDELNLDADSAVIGDMESSWALPLGQLELSLNDHWDLLDSLQIEASPESGILQFVQPFEAFSSAPLLMEPLDEALTFNWLLDDVSASVVSLIPAGESGSYGSAVDWSWGVNDMSSLDSLWLDSGSWLVQVSSDLPMDLEVIIRTSNIVLDGEPFECLISLDYTGSLPVVASQSIALDNRTVQFSEPMNPSIRLDWEMEWLASGQPVSPGEAVDVDVSFVETAISAAFGNFEENIAWSFEMGQAIPALDNLITGDVHFADPQIHLWMNNSSGIPIGVEWSEFKFLKGGVASVMSGSDIDEFPVISGAMTPGDDAETIHTIDNSGTSPSLSTVLDEMPDSLFLNGAIAIHAQEEPSFLLATSRVALEGELRLPMNGWASSLQWEDTVNVQISESLESALQPPLDWQDIASVAIRLHCENRLPIGVQVQALFLNGQGSAIDSLTTNANGWQLIDAGQVNTAGSPSDANYGRVTNPIVQTIDWVFDREMAQELIGQDCQSIVVRAMLETSDVSSSQDVRFYPEDGFRVELGMRVDLDLNWNP